MQRTSGAVLVLSGSVLYGAYCIAEAVMRTISSSMHAGTTPRNVGVAFVLIGLLLIFGGLIWNPPHDSGGAR